MSIEIEKATSLEKKVDNAPSSTSSFRSGSQSSDGETLEGEDSGISGLSNFSVIVITSSLMLAVFCVALDNTMIPVAIPNITDDFKNLNDVGWYASAYLLTTCAFQLPFGKMYSIFNVKIVFLAALFIFETGSLICGVAPSSIVLIIGRALIGIGSAGIFVGSMATLVNMVSMEKRPLFFGVIGGTYGLGTLVGPLLGGVFTDNATWRWCFYINLPLGVVTAAIVVVMLKLPPVKRHKRDSAWVTVKRLDLIGSAAFIPSIICVLLALEQGGVEYAWSNGRIIALFVVFGVLLAAFTYVQILMKDEATVPPRIAMQRTIAFSSLFSFLAGGVNYTGVYYIPIWFQVIKDTSAVQSGIYSLPMMVAIVIGLFSAGVITSKVGHYAPLFIVSSVIMPVGAGLITTFEVDTPLAKWVGYQFIFGLGVGLGYQQGYVAAQAVLPPDQAAIGTAVVMFVQTLGGTVFVSVAQNLFANKLISNFLTLDIPNVDPHAIVHAGATRLSSMVEPSKLPAALIAYNDAMMKPFQLCIILSCLTMIGSLGVEWKSVKGG